MRAPPDHARLGRRVQSRVAPDGQRVVFERWVVRQGLPRQLYVVNANGSGAHQIASGCSKATKCIADSMPAWSRDGAQIAFARDYGPKVKIGLETEAQAGENPATKRARQDSNL